MIWVILIFVVGAIIIAAMGNSDRQKQIEQTKDQQGQILRDKKITRTVDCEWIPLTNDERFRFIADDNAEKIYLSAGITATSFSTIPYAEIIGIEILEDSKVVGGIKRAIVGGVLAGGAGAIVGATTAHKKELSSYKIIIYRENVSQPTYEMEFVKKGIKLKTTSQDYKSAEAFVTKIQGVIKAIISKTEKKTLNRQLPTTDSSMQNQNDDMSNKLKQLKKALDEKMISETEYNEKRKEILDSL